MRIETGRVCLGLRGATENAGSRPITDELLASQPPLEDLISYVGKMGTRYQYGGLVRRKRKKGPDM